MFARLFDAALATRFLAVGALNTLFGYSIILAGLAAGIGDIAANIVGHVLGFGFSYYMHHRFTYRQKGHGRSPLLYLVSVLVAFAVNMAVVVFATEKLGLVDNPLVHLVAIGAYAVTLYFLGTMFAFNGNTSTSAPIEWRRYWPELGTVAIWLVALPILPLFIVLTPDVSWQLWIGRHLNAGVPLYDWIMEVNPPLWFWMAQPVSALADLLQVSPHTTLIIVVWILVGGSLALSAAIISDWDAPSRAIVLGSLLLAVYTLVMSEYGQREHEAYLALVPYALLTARRVEGRSIPWVLALAVGVFVTPMIALKHYFVLLPIVLEAWLIWRTRKLQLFRPETLSLAIGAVLYALAIVLFTPSYLTDMVPVLSAAYGDVRMPWLVVFLHPMNAAVLVGAFYFWHFRRDLPDVVQALLVIAFGFFVAYYAQAKGFFYHAEPIVAALTAALAVDLMLRQRSTHSINFAPALLAGCVAVILLGPATIGGPFRNSNAAVVDPYLEALAPGTSIAPLTTRPSLLRPMVATAEVQLPLRYYHLWMLDSVANTEARGEEINPKLAAFTDVVRHQHVEDMLCNPPDLVMVDLQSVRDTNFDMLGFFMKSAAFADIFTAYEPDGRLGIFDVYRRVADLPEPVGIECMKIGVGLKSPA